MLLICFSSRCLDMLGPCCMDLVSAVCGAGFFRFTSVSASVSLHRRGSKKDHPRGALSIGRPLDEHVCMPICAGSLHGRVLCFTCLIFISSHESPRCTNFTVRRTSHVPIMFRSCISSSKWSPSFLPSPRVLSKTL